MRFSKLTKKILKIKTLQNDFENALKCCCAPEFEGDEYFVAFQTWNLTWTRGLRDSNSKEFRDKKVEFTNELQEKILQIAFNNSEILHFEVTGFGKGPKNVVIIEGKLILKQSHIENEEFINSKVKSALAKYFYESPKTL